jgi:protein ImuB
VHGSSPDSNHWRRCTDVTGPTGIFWSSSWRIEPEWWRDPPDRLARDYYRVELDTGARLWVGRTGAGQPDQAARWFLHGYLP